MIPKSSLVEVPQPSHCLKSCRTRQPLSKAKVCRSCHVPGNNNGDFWGYLRASRNSKHTPLIGFLRKNYRKPCFLFIQVGEKLEWNHEIANKNVESIIKYIQILDFLEKKSWKPLKDGESSSLNQRIPSGYLFSVFPERGSLHRSLPANSWSSRNRGFTQLLKNGWIFHIVMLVYVAVYQRVPIKYYNIL